MRLRHANVQALDTERVIPVRGDTIPYGFCHCGCGGKTNLAPQARRGIAKGEPYRFLVGHGTRGQHTPRQPCVICGEPESGRGWCKKHYMKWYHYGHPEVTGRKTMTVEEKAEARRQSAREHYARFRERYKEKHAASPEKDIQRGRAWRKHHPDKAEKARKRWSENNIEYEKAMRRAWKAKNPEKVRAIKLRAENKRRAVKLKVFIEDVDPVVVFNTCEGVCGICDKPIEGPFHVDHIIPLARGGVHSYANVQAAHPSCNLKKGARVDARKSLDMGSLSLGLSGGGRSS